jgi:RNA polymerase sigma-70 factor (ECF subfamily)
MVPTDETLLTQYKKGDERAFRALVQRYTTPIYNLTLRLLRDPMEAENVTQETFLRVVTSLDRVRLDIPFKPYLFRIAVNLCRDLARKRQPLLFSDLDSAAHSREDGGEPEVTSQMIADETPPLSERLEKEELEARLHTAFEALPSVYQMVVTLKYTEDFSYEEIAQTLNVPLNTVRTQLRRAKQILKIKLEKDFVPARKPNDFVHTRTAEGGF